MKNIFTLLIISLTFSFTIHAQEVVLQRVSELMPEGYNIEGQAFLEEFSNGELKLRLSEDFATPPGPDVRILLGNALSVGGTEQVVNLSSVSHFSGARTFDVSSDINIDDFKFILFFCVNFQQFWASGSFGETTSPDGGGSVFDCEQSRLSLLDGAISIDICPTDQVSDVIEFDNSINAVNNYAYLITDENDILQQVVNSNSFDFEGSTTATQRVHGIHFDGDLIPAIGEDRLFTESTECFFHSFATGFITIEKTGTCNTSFICEESLTATTDWMVSTDICPSDAQDDIIELRNNLFIPPGNNYAYLITDANEIVQQVVMDTFYNFEGSSMDEQRVYGIHYDGTLNPAIGQNRMQTSATGCFTHSGNTLFLTITKGACTTVAFECQESLTATTDWATEADICTIDGAADWVILRNTLSVPAGLNYVYLLTDESEILQEVIFDSLYNFEGTGDATQRIYGLSFSGNLAPQVGQNRLNTEASDCFIHSGANLFLTINKTSACQTNSTRSAFLQEAIAISPNPSKGRFYVSYDEVLDVQKIQIFDNSGRLINEPTSLLDFEIVNSGIYLVRFITKDNSITKKVVVQ